MQVEVLHEFTSTLPADDIHRYRSGVWHPQTVERKAWDLPVVGEIPDDLNGVYLRNTENPLHPAISENPAINTSGNTSGKPSTNPSNSSRYHPFDGDGMVHSMSFTAGEATYHNRFVRTDALLAETQAQQSLWAGVAESPAHSIRDDSRTARPNTKDSSSTDVVVHQGMAHTSFYLCGDLYQLDPITLETLGTASWNGAFPTDGVSAHTKIDEVTGEMLFFNYSRHAPYMHYGVVSPTGELVHYIDVELPGPRLTHDMAFTQNYAILNDCPLFWDPKAMAAGAYAPRWFGDDLPTRFAIVPRRGTSEEIRWFEAEPTFVLHWINAYEDGDGDDGTVIVLDGFFERDPSPVPRAGDTTDDTLFRYLDMHRLLPEVRRWRFNLRTGETTEETLSDRVMEFSAINASHAGRRHRYSYNALPVDGWWGFKGLIKHDIDTGTEEVVEFPEGVFGSEPAMAPRNGSTAEDAKNEDDGYVLTYVSDLNTDTSACWIFDAADITAGPVAKVGLPERISSGTHACWAPASAL